MLNCKQIKSVLKNKVRLTESFLVFFLITGSISYGKVATEITKDEIIEKAYTIIGNIDNPNVIINCLEDEDAKEKYNAMVSEAGISLTNNGTILAKVALKGEKSVAEALGNGIYTSEILTYERINDIVDVRNNGVISGYVNIEGEELAGTFASGNGVLVYGWTSNVVDIENNGMISGYVNIASSIEAQATYLGNGIYGGENTSVRNNGVISGYVNIEGGELAGTFASGNGILVYGWPDNVIDVRNNGVISGDINIERATSNNQAFANGSGNGVYVSGAPLWTILDKNGKISRVVDVENSGVISGYVNVSGEANLDFASFSSVGASGNGVYGLYGSGNNEIIDVDNSGVILGYVSMGGGESAGIFASGNGVYGLVKSNTGTISGKVTSTISTFESGNGIVIPNNFVPTKYSANLASIDNYGLVKGLESAIYRGNLGILVNNYGILAGQQIIGSADISTKVYVNDYNNYGTEVIIDENGEVLSVNVGAGGTIDDYTILNGSKEAGKNRYTNASQLEKTSNLIINGVGINDTGALTVDQATTLNNSIINGYETALTVNGGSKFTGTDVTFNGGGFGKFNEDTKKVEYEAVIKGDAGDNILEILGNSFINGKVDLGAGNDYLLVSNGIQINGDMDGGDGADTLKLGNGVHNEDHPLNNHDGNNDSIIDKGDWRGLAIYHEIKNFENIDVEGAVTLYETAKIIGDSNIHIGKDSSLNLRIDPTKKDSNGRIIGHALYTNGDKKITAEVHSGTITEYESKGGGTLNIITNGIGVGGVIAMSELKIGRAPLESIGETILDPNKENLYVRTDSIIHSATVHTEKNIVALSTGPTPQVGDIKVTVGQDLLEIINPPEPPIDPEPPVNKYQPRYIQLNKIYKSLIADGDNINAIYPTTSITLLKQYLDYPVQSDVTDIALGNLLTLLNEIYTVSPYSFSSELSRESMGLYSDAIIDNPFKAKEKEWMVYGGLLHESVDLKDRYYGKNYHGFDTTDKTTNVKVDNKITGAYALAEYGIDSSLSVGGILGGSKNKSDISNKSNLDGNSFYIGGYIKKDIEEWRITGGLGYQYTDYDAKRGAGNMMQSFSYENSYNDNGLNIYLNGRYNYSLGNDYYLVPKAKLSYTHIKQDGVNEGDKPLAMNVDSKSFDVFEGLIGLDLKKEFLHENGKSALKAGIAYKRILSGYEDEYLTANMKNGNDFDLLISNKVKNNYIVGVGYEYESQKGILFNINGSYSFDVKESNSVRDNSGTKNSVNGWIVGLGIGYRLSN